MRRERLVLRLSSVIFVFLPGCDSGTPSPQQPAEQTSNTSPQPPPPAAPSLTFQLPPSQTENTLAATAESATPEPPEMISEVASVGSGKKGHGYGGGMITEPARAYFRTKERIAFQVTIPNAMKTYKAIDPENKGPRSHEEFMERIIKENAIELPILPDGHRYRYDPESEDLLIERPQ